MLGLLAGCGAPEVTTEEFIARADAICRETKDEVASLPPPRLPSEIEEHVKRAALIIDDGLDRLRQLEIPEADRPTVEGFFRALQDSVGYLPGFGRAAARNKTIKLQEATEKLEETSERAQDIATAFGFKVCGGVSDQDLGST
ncbi:MAG TPA: hypothetical protein VHJ82_01135 [Actinomycetota bacterium]|nr:hypothetical protein [Actinomycetota bacterium]